MEEILLLFLSVSEVNTACAVRSKCEKIVSLLGLYYWNGEPDAEKRLEFHGTAYIIKVTNVVFFQVFTWVGSFKAIAPLYCVFFIISSF